MTGPFDMPLDRDFEEAAIQEHDYYIMEEYGYYSR